MAGNSSDDARWLEKERSTGAVDWCPITVAISPVINGELQRVTVMRWRCQGTWRKVSRRPSPVNFSAPVVRQGGTTNLIRARVRVNPVPRSLPYHGYPLASEHGPRRRESWRKDCRWQGGMNRVSSSVTVPWHPSPVDLTKQLEAGFSPKFTWQPNQGSAAKL